MFGCETVKKNKLPEREFSKLIGIFTNNMPYIFKWVYVILCEAIEMKAMVGRDLKGAWEDVADFFSPHVNAIFYLYCLIMMCNGPFMKREGVMWMSRKTKERQ